MPADPLAAYNRKRDFGRTAEPAGTRAKDAGNSFVVQKHAATRLHWDFRLEMDGVLKSWAVTRGPSLNPDDKRLAVRTEDHPVSYGGFEGIIPKGEYGGGTVMLWDNGTWEPIPGKSADDLKDGHLHFILHGKRMQGEWLLVRMKPRPGEKGENWLLRKVDDRFARHDGKLVDEALTSVTTGRTMAEIAAGKAAEPPKSRRKCGPPPFQPPQLATLVDHVPTGGGWLHEIKFDGYRALISVAGRDMVIRTRTGLDWTAKFPGVAAALAALDLPPALIDGEVVALDAHGNPAFQALQKALKEGGEMEYFAFDLLTLDGRDLRREPNISRKELLADLLRDAKPPIHVAEHVEGAGEKLLATMCGAGQEGIICKRADAPYLGRRGKNWLKVKCTRRDEFVVIGWTKSSTKARPFASLLLAERDGDLLTYRGKVGTGFDAARMADLAAQLQPLAAATPATEVPRPEARGATWVQPLLVAEVAYAEITGDGRVRHASFLGLRDDKPAAEARVETPAPADPPVKISNRDRIIFPEAKLTKGDLSDYCAAMAPLMLEHMAGRPLSLVRCPQGRAKACFFQKHDSGSFGQHVRHVPIREKDGAVENYLYVEDAAGILACVQMGSIEFHGWACHAADVEKPDRMIFDLDPDEGLGFAEVKKAAAFLHDRLAELGLTSFAMLSGGKGVHVVAPLTPGHGWDAHKDFARRFAEALSTAEPERFTATMSKAKRKGRIFIDWLRNQRGATAILPWSARARPGAPVALPIAWDELAEVKTPALCHINDVAALLQRGTRLKGWGEAAQTLPDA